ncbi:hypothetical protein ACPA9J_21995 [Pseudomonas aeruginosa]
MMSTNVLLDSVQSPLLDGGRWPRAGCLLRSSARPRRRYAAGLHLPSSYRRRLKRWRHRSNPGSHAATA